MKILFLAPQPFFEVRGTPINVKLFVTALSQIGHTVDLLVYPHGQDVTIPNVTVKRIIKIPGIPKAPIGPSKVKIFYDALMLIHVFFLRLTRKYDAIHAVEESVFIAWIIKKIFGTPYIFDMDSHMSDQLRYSKFFFCSHPLRFIEWMENSAMRNSAKIVTVCHYLTDVALKTVPQNKIVQIEDIPMAADPPPEGLTKQKLRADLSIPSDAPVLLYTGNFEKYQGVDLLLDCVAIVAEQFPSVRFVAVGGNLADTAKYRARVDELKVSDNVIFTGAKPPEWMSVFADMADILLSPRLEGTNTPLKIYTYLKSGKPVVATELPTHTQILTKQIAVLTKPEKMEYAAGILLLLNDKSLRESLGESAREFVDENFNYEVFRNKVETAYSGL